MGNFQGDILANFVYRFNMANILGRTASLGLRSSLRNCHQVNCVVPNRSDSFFLPFGVRKAMHKFSAYNQMGLHKDDLIPEDDHVKEAIGRLAPKVQDERLFRMMRAQQVSRMKTCLPKDQWPTY